MYFSFLHSVILNLDQIYIISLFLNETQQNSLMEANECENSPQILLLL